MIYRVKHKIHNIKKKLYTVIQDEFDDEYSLKKLKKEDRQRIYLKKLMNKHKDISKNIIGKEFRIQYVEIVLTTVCTLRCKACSNLIQYYEKPYHTDIDVNLKALSRLLKSVDCINNFGILGGEPLCYPALKEFLLFVRDAEKIKKITIYTNGTLIIKDVALLEILKNKKFTVFISNYGDNSYKKTELVDILKKNDIKYVLPENDFVWSDYGNLNLRKRSGSELKKQYLKCKIPCNSILNGKIYHCPRSSNGTDLNVIPLKENEYVDLLEKSISIRKLRKKLYKFIYGYIPYIEACKYCDRGTDNRKQIKPGAQMK